MGQEFLSNQFILLVVFVFSFAGILLTSFSFVEIINSFYRRFSFSKTFVGSFLLAASTSFPELVNAVAAGIEDRQNPASFQSINSFYNITGANSLQIVFLSCTTIIFGIFCLIKGKKDDYAIFVGSLIQKKLIIWSLIFIEVWLLIIFLIFNETFKNLSVGGINIFAGIFFLIWIGYFLFTFFEKKTSDSIEEHQKSNFLDTLGNKTFLFLGLIVWVFFALISWVNFKVVSKFETVFHIPKNIALGIFLALITSTPEFSAFFFLVKKRSYNVAILGFLGSSIFNLMLPFITNLISQKWVFSYQQFSAEHRQKIFIWLINDILINIFYILGTTKITNKTTKKPLIFSFLIIFTFVLMNVLILKINTNYLFD